MSSRSWQYVSLSTLAQYFAGPRKAKLPNYPPIKVTKSMKNVSKYQNASRILSNSFKTLDCVMGVQMVDFRCPRPAWQFWSLNGHSVSSSETDVINGMRKLTKQMYFHQLNDRKLFVAFISAKSEGLQLYSQTIKFENFKRYLEREFLGCISSLHNLLYFRSDDRDIVWKGKSRHI